MRPPVPYFGGKIRLAPRLVDLLVRIPHGHYVEPYAGSLAVLLAKPPVCHETVNDLDGDLVTFWRVLREQPEALARVCTLTPHARSEQETASDLNGATTDLERARRVWVLLTQSRAGIMRPSGWRHYQSPSGSTGSMPDYLDAYVRRIAPAAARLAHVSLECRSGVEVAADYGRHPGCLLYVDPPYVTSTRSSGAYRHEMTDQDHRDLAEVLHAAQAAVVLSGYASPLYDDLYAGWYRLEIPTATGQGGQWSERTEVVWSNRRLSEPSLFDYLAEAAASGTASETSVHGTVG